MAGVYAQHCFRRRLALRAVPTGRKLTRQMNRGRDDKSQSTLGLGSSTRVLRICATRVLRKCDFSSTARESPPS